MKLKTIVILLVLAAIVGGSVYIRPITIAKNKYNDEVCTSKGLFVRAVRDGWFCVDPTTGIVFDWYIMEAKK